MPSAAEKLSEWLSEGYIPPGSALLKAAGRSVVNAGKAALPDFLERARDPNDNGFRGLRYPVTKTDRPDIVRDVKPSASPDFSPIAPVYPSSPDNSDNADFEPIAPLGRHISRTPQDPIVNISAPEKIYKDESSNPDVEDSRGAHEKLFDAVKSAYPKFKEETAAAPAQGLQEMANYERVNPVGSALGFMGNVVAGKGARAFKQVENMGRVFGGVADRLPRFEVADRMAQLKGALPEIGKDAKLGDILDHPELFYNYPELKDLTVRKMPPTFENAGKTGSFGLDANGKAMITISGGRSPEELKSSLLHEIQHAIQDKEGFGQGTHGESPEYAGNPGELEAQAVSRRMNLTPEALDASPIKDFLMQMERMKS